MTKQIAIDDQLYDQLTDIRNHRGRKYSFNTVIRNLLREALITMDHNELYRKMQWHAIQSNLKQLEHDGWAMTFRLQDAHVLRMLCNGQFKAAAEYIQGQYPEFMEET